MGANQLDGGWTELATPTAAWNEARTLALGRMRTSRSLRAIAVVDVSYRRIGYDWATGAIEIVALGTAVRSAAHARREQAIPLTNLSGEDVWKLLESGWWPLGIVAGSTVVYVLSSYQTAQAAVAHRHGRPEPGARGLHERVYEARDLALRHVRRDAAEVGASGVIGLSLEHAFREREVSTGTASSST